MMNYKALTLIAAALTFAAPAIAANLQAGKAYMEKHCAQCHGKDGIRKRPRPRNNRSQRDSQELD